MTKSQVTSEPVWKQENRSCENTLQYITTEQSNAKKCETNSSKINTSTDLLCNKSTSSETADVRIQQQEIVQLRNESSRIPDAELEIKPLTDITVNIEDIKPGCYINSYIKSQLVL